MKAEVVLFVFLFFALLYLVLYLIKLKRQPPVAVGIGTVFFVYLSLVAVVTLFPLQMHPIGHPGLTFTYNLVPFRDVLFAVAHHISLRSSARGIIGNILLFMPFGFMVPLLFRRHGFVSVLVSAFLVSLSIELLQLATSLFLVSTRIFDVTDLITNTSGGCLGFAAYKILWRLFLKKAKRRP